jgi:hypothetical protein
MTGPRALLAEHPSADIAAARPEADELTMSGDGDAGPETDLSLIGGESLRVKGSVDQVASSISLGLDPERSGWVILSLADGQHVRVRVAAVAYVRAAPPPPSASAERFVRAA